MILDDQSTAQCQLIIQKLAEIYQSVSFTPHITLAGTPGWSPKKIKEAIDDIAAETSPLPFKTTSVRCSSKPYQKLTLGIEVSRELENLHKKTDQQFKGDFAKTDYPHISFLYSRIECWKTDQEIEKVEMDAPDRVTARQLALVQCKGTPESWKTLFEWDLKK